MNKQTARILVSIPWLLLLQSGCATAPTGSEGRKTESGDRAPVVRELIRNTRSWNGELLPAYPQGQPEIAILRISIPPGTRLPMHSHPVINAGLLLSGELTVMTADGKTRHLKAGDPLIEVVNTMHYGSNHGKVPAEILVFYAGAPGIPLTVPTQKD
jgi:quercetin dioxygenase-like cupin family protein